MKRLSLLLFLSFPVLAQQQSLDVVSPVILSSGKAYASMSFARFHKATFPLSGLEGELTKIGTINFMFSYSGMVELAFDGTILNLLSISKRYPAFNSAITSTNNPVGDVGDLTLWTKIYLLNENRSLLSLSLRTGVQLPNASNESGLGIDEMNFYSSLLFEKHFAGIWIFNIGFAILGSPTEFSAQHDMLTYGLKYVFPITSSTMVFLQAAGRKGHEGTGIYNLAHGKAGVEIHFNNIKFFGSGVLNFAPSDNSYGVELGVGYSFQLISPE
ncbi:MAG: hypothetical protein H3C35_05115 [Bacteroidetes bacterium]|nr:hypothetical protein [Bacteroidota bacterium]